MQAEFNVVTNKFRVKGETGKWQEVPLTRVNSNSPDDTPPELTVAEKAAQEKRNDFVVKLSALQRVIEDAKQKAELVNLGIESAAALEKKKEAYLAAKAAYDAAKDGWNNG
ncbi:hypothetical protein NO1_1290 [Candidatus Termititenax aidoneus]|uniref:Uncharacterized protein n=1 Tax=Termititenax aidoneus TaxID=2218524 RepID=A0A388TCG6_TERA1|nr:hypothetical protein NO1_1290 [Candidatus Termititenax aidoneus]